MEISSNFEWIDVDAKLVRLEQSLPVQVAPFTISRYPVTVGEFRMFCSQTGYATTAESRGMPTYFDNPELKKLLRMSASTRARYGIPRELNESNATANYLSQVDAQSYCDWAKVRLPTELEWLSASILNWSDEFDDVLDHFNHYGKRPDALHEVGCEWTATKGTRERLEAICPRMNPFKNELAGEAHQSGTCYAVLRRGPQYVLPSAWQSRPGGIVVPTLFFHALVSFRVCKGLLN